MAWTAYTFHQPISTLLEIGDWWVARELDVVAAQYVQEELFKREIEREKRDREFWIQMFSKPEPEAEDQDFSLEDNLSRSALAR